nr:PREDICTED: YEATS domain-containing protein 2 [Megachile rotundata]XP_012149601.1 PREDICTED: YEATS domain-containing protein 2 [Megachile rotundata]XP_012149602.1 PREDICTED: YEATS domain-containing protein 2 [Megachile rotundata]XP_012149603.1 PREDICTED: YEATS domain-containing protein 2 [Megachile rotundata]XP_012149605.1 PREDICTED: YEATS domain-containing protein 2 [Megachile rotundata]
MSALKDQDPDYGPSVANNEKHQRIYEENARSSTARKITTIIEREFSQEIDIKEKEVLEIQERLQRASKVLHLLRYVIVTDFYNRKQCQNSQNGEAKQTQIHPAIKQLIGKSPKSSYGSVVPASTATSNNTTCYGTLQSFSTSPTDCIIKKEKSTEETNEHCRVEKRNNETNEESRPKKIPRYIPPKSGIPESEYPSRGIRHKVRKRIIIGNISKWIPPEWREDAASHKWTMYVRGNKENPDIDDFVSKVRFFLHPSYRPNDVVEVTSVPFCLSRRGWGEFPLRVQLHFKSVLNKPMDIIHYLKLDRTYTGLQTLGAETLVDIWIYVDPRNSKRNVGKTEQDILENENNCRVKLENDERLQFDSQQECDFLNSTINESISKDSGVVIKQEISSDFNINENSIDTKQMQLYVDLDHDYCGSKYLNYSEGNLTINHSLTTSLNNVSSENPHLEENKEKTTENTNLTDSSINADLSKLKEKEETINVGNSSIVNESNRNRQKALPLGCSKLQSNLRPLQISIPPLFEPSGSKHVLVLENNQTIPVDIAVPRTSDYNNDQTRSKASFTASRGISLLKKPLDSETIIQVRNPNGTNVQQGLKVQLSKSMFLNVNSNIPVLKIAERRNSFNVEKESTSEQTTKINQQELKEYKLSRRKITLGKDKHKLQSRKEFYDDVLQSIETAKIADIQGLLRFIIRRMPMITQDAMDSDYRRLHPYACVSEEEFFGYNLAKQNACEWSRAKIIKSFIKKKSFPEEKLWSIKEIMIWSRLHGYTPLCSDFTMQFLKQQKNLPDSTIVKNMSTCTEPDTFCKWLQTYPGRLNDSSFDSTLQQVNGISTEVDVVNIDNALESIKSQDKESKELPDKKITALNLETKFVPLYNFIHETAREIGIELVSEEIVPNVVYCATGRMIMRAVECLVEDLVRMSLAKAWERCSDDGHPKVIVLDDVRGALLNREEFDIFTNEGLGSKYRLSVMD